MPCVGLKDISAVGHAGLKKRKIMKKQYLIMIALVFGIGLFFAGQVQAQDLWDTNVNHIFNTNTGNVGIGTENPVQLLDVNGRIAMGVGGRLFARRSTGELQEMFTLDGANDIFINRQSVTHGFVTGVGIMIGPGKTFTIRDEGNNQLMRMNENTGNFGIGYNPHSTIKLAVNGPVAIGLNSALPDGVKLAVDGDFLLDGKMVSREIEVRLDVWPDFVFADDYNLMTLDQVENYILQNSRLPEVPSEAEVVANGVNLGEMSAILLQKIEELTLHVIELNKQNQELQKRISNLEK